MEEAGGEGTHLIKLLLVVIYAEGRESNSSWNRCLFALAQELTEWQIDLPRIQNETSRQIVMSFCFFFFFFETGAAVWSLMCNKVFGKGSQLVRLESLMWGQHGNIFCWATVKVKLG